MSNVFVILLMSLVSNAVPANKDAPKVILEEIKLLDDTRKIVVPVKVEPKIQSVVSADIEGFVTKIAKPLGATVKAGDVILFIENKDPGFTYAAVPVRSPVSGIVSQMWASQMAKVGRGEKLFTVMNPQSLKLSAEFPSAELAVVKAGLRGKFNVSNSQAGAALDVKVVGISPLVDTRTGTASSELEFVGNLSSLPPVGTVGQVLFEIKMGSVMMIPEASLFYNDGKPMVRILKGTNQFTKVPIELGEQRDSSFVIKSGVSKGEKVVVRSSRPLKEGESFEVDSTTKTQ